MGAPSPTGPKELVARSTPDAHGNLHKAQKRVVFQNSESLYPETLCPRMIQAPDDAPGPGNRAPGDPCGPAQGSQRCVPIQLAMRWCVVVPSNRVVVGSGIL